MWGASLMGSWPRLGILFGFSDVIRTTANVSFTFTNDFEGRMTELLLYYESIWAPFLKYFQLLTFWNTRHCVWTILDNGENNNTQYYLMENSCGWRSLVGFPDPWSSLKLGHNCGTASFTSTRELEKDMATPVFLLEEPRTWDPGGLPLASLGIIQVKDAARQNLTATAADEYIVTCAC